MNRTQADKMKKRNLPLLSLWVYTLTVMTDKETLELLRSLVETESVTGNEGNIVELLEKTFHSLGFSTLLTYSGCICGVIDSGKPGPTVLIDGHIDTVGIPDISRWSTDPFTLVQKDGRLYGRGTSDMKGGVAAAIAAASELIPLKKGKVVVACIVEEERFEGICAREVSDFFFPDYVIIAESTHGKLNIGQRGRCEVLLRAEGKSCHSSNPEEGENAVLNAVKAIEALETLRPGEHEVLGKGIMVLTDIISSPYPGMSIVPEECRVTYDRRTLVGETPESVISPINSLLEEKGIKASASIALGSTTSYTGHTLTSPRFFPAWCYSPDDDIVKKSRSGLEKAGLFTGYGHYAFCTNGSHYGGEKHLPVIGYGPGEERFAHIVDEYIEESDLYRIKRGMKAIVEALLD